MNWKGFFVVVIVCLAIYGVYYFVTQADFVRLLSIPRIFDPFATSVPATRPVRSSPPTPTPRASAPTVRTPPAVNLPTPPEGFSVADLSPYYDRVRITSVRRPDRYGIGGGFTVRVEEIASLPVDVTGWEVHSNRGSFFITGAGAPIGPVNQTRIAVRPNTSAEFYAAWSSFVKNVELNACTGYLNDLYTLSPELPTNCPRPAQSELVNFSGECQNFIGSLQSCETPSPSELNQYVVSGDPACRAFMDTLTYEGCVRKYQNLSNFYSYGWRVWLGTDLHFDPYHDRLFLVDGAGKLVDEYIY